MINRRMGAIGIRRNLRGPTRSAAAAYDPLTDPVFAATWDPASASNTLSGSDIDVLADLKGSGRDLSALTSGQRPAQATSANLGGATIADFVSATPDCLRNATKSLWRLLHEGTGCTLIVVYYVTGSQTHLIWDTNSGSTTLLGAHWAHDTTNGRLIVRVANGSASAISYVGANASAPAGAYVATFRFEDGRAGNEYDIRLSGVSKASGNTTTTIATGDASGNFRVGLTNAASLPFNGPMGAAFLATSYLTDAKVAEVEAWATARYGT